MTATVHEYVSTAYAHDLCGSCRQTCKFCDAPCLCACHREGDAERPQPWVDQARSIARELLRVTLNSRPTPPDLLYRIETDPDLFWLRGEEQPPGEWREPGSDK
jgi:hypothetical protein